MHTFYFALVSITLLTFLSHAQNLVPNPDFETTGDCGYYFGRPEAAPPWFNPTTSTPDYYYGNGECGHSSFNNPNGFQLPYSGLAYPGLWVFTTGGLGSREYIECQLLSSLEQGEMYTVEFFLSRAEECRYASDMIGAYFSTDSVVSSNYLELPYVPQVENSAGNILTDSVNWTLITGQFIADGGERYITIGNFKTESETQWLDINPSSDWGCAYYYIEDVSVFETQGTGAIEVEFEPETTLYPLPFSEVLNVKIRLPVSAEFSGLQIRLMDVMERTYYPEFEHYTDASFSRIKVSRIGIPSGVYSLVVQFGKHVLTRLVVIV